MKFLVAILAVGLHAHQSFQGSTGFAPHWEEPFWHNNDDPNGQEFRQDHTRGSTSKRDGAGTQGTNGRGGAFFRGAEQDDNYLNKDDDRRVWAPAYDDHVSYSHHPVAHQFSDEHYHDDEGQSTRVIHGQDTSQHVNRRTKKKVFDTIKEPKHHFAVQSIDVPFPFHHHYYNHTKVHYHDGYDLYDDDVGDSEKYYHVNPDTHTNVDGWFADDHYRISNEAFDDEGTTVDDGFRTRNGRPLDDGAPSRREFHGGETHGDYTQQYPYGQAGRTGGLAEGSYGNHGAYNRFKADDANAGSVYPNENYRAEVLNGEDVASDDSVANRPEALRYRWFANDRLAEWRMRNPNYYTGAGRVGSGVRGAGQPRFYNTGTGTVMRSRGPRAQIGTQQAGSTTTGGANARRGRAQDGNNARAGGNNNRDWMPFSGTSFANTPLSTNANGLDADGSAWGGQFPGLSFNPLISQRAMWSSDKPLTNSGTIGTLGGRTYSRGYYGHNAKDSQIPNSKSDSNTSTTKDVDTYRRMRNVSGGEQNMAGSARAFQGLQSQVGSNGQSLRFKTFGQRTGTEGTMVGGALANYKYNWDNAELSSYPRGIRENTTGVDEDGQDDDNAQDNVEDNQNDNDGTEYQGPAGGNGGETTGEGGWPGSWNLQDLVSAITDSIMGQFREYGSGMFPSGSEGEDADRRLLAAN